MEGQTVLPGDWIALPQSCRLGPGLYNDAGDCEPDEDSDVRACMAGVVRKRETVSSKAVQSGTSGKPGGRKMAWVDYSSRRVRQNTSTGCIAHLLCSLVIDARGRGLVIQTNLDYCKYVTRSDGQF